jgi:mTERF domain-containing protein
LTDNQISSLIVKRPVLLSYDPEKHIKPKLDFFKSIAFSPSDMEDILSLDPFIFDRNLETQMIPSYQYLKSVLHKDADVNFAIRRCTWVLKQDARQTIAPNVEVLRESGVPCDRILWILKNYARSLIQMPDKFMKITEEVKKMGFDPRTFNFLEAIRILMGGSDLISEKKKLYKKWGWSDEEVLTAFMKAPAFLIRSEKKVDNIMDFLVNKMGWNSSDVAGCPQVFYHSLEGWIIPRCSVYRFLLSKGLIKEKRIATLLKEKKGIFLKRYVEAYSVEFPELLTIYQPKVVSVEKKLFDSGGIQIS